MRLHNCQLQLICLPTDPPIRLSKILTLTHITTVYSYCHRSVDLIEQLVRDVVSTTASYKQLQERESRLLSDFSSAQAQLFPLRKENSRLNRENQQLHVDSIQQKDQAIVAIDAHKSELRGLEDRLREMKELTDAKERDYRSMEKERERMREVSPVSPVTLYRRICISRWTACQDLSVP